ncbi:DUF3224 domain-containing protein [Kibdelosporangium philippinense]|uniref:DUF3224 domain-containing protein n=1 Tax=Kibdelosporangium philippinense TaxID=211113 RepID=A0ABS8Z889_9PSEU|nr:DUF3224 domain-containing protein [Kibdelosporangium philippinense]MCE7004110.1 DUF3224 domain-containing protein [Kibdelosporangium philippinense]
MKLTATFEITGWDQLVYDDHHPPLTSATITKTYTGALQATGQVHMLACQTGEDPSDGAGYMAQERVTGELEGKTGTFVLQHGACGGPDGSEQYGFIVPGSATGQLATLTGTCRMRHGEISLDYHLG